jgi:hypothetical protein
MQKSANGSSSSHRSSKATLKVLLFIFVLVSLLGLAIFLMTGLRALNERADFPNEGKLIQSKASLDTRISDIGSLINFVPEVVCFNVRGGDPRLAYNASPYASRPLDTLPKYIEEGYMIFLFAGKSQYYIEKFDYTDIYFDELARSRCERISASFSITFTRPTNKFIHSRLSGFVNFSRQPKREALSCASSRGGGDVLLCYGNRKVDCGKVGRRAIRPRNKPASRDNGRSVPGGERLQ